MPDYDDWNRALITYFVEETPVGTPVFLAADDDTLVRVGRRLLGATGPMSPSVDGVQDFQAAVQGRVVRAGGRVDLSGVQGTGAGEVPRCAAFLCALVLAASRMRDTGNIDDVNYFARLRDVLGLPAIEGRPEGLPRGSEERLWKDWNFWLQVHGRLPTAMPGPERHPHRFIHYALSQALLRDVDKDHLRRLFATRGWRSAWDAETLLLHVRREMPNPTVHLRSLLASDSGRLQAVGEAIHDLYEGWRLDPTGTFVPSSGRRHVLYAGLYREEDPLAGAASYHLYPRAARGVTAELRVRIGNVVETLRPERPGWYYPLGPVDGATLARGERYPVEQPADVDELVLPARNFWILVPDPEYPDVGVYASWGPPQLGLPFVLLCREQMLSQLREMKQEQLIQYPDEPVPVLDGSWYELRDCLAISEAWSSAHSRNPELYDALRPADACNVSAAGGLRLPGRQGWLDEAGPSVTVVGFAPEGEVIITDVHTGRTVIERSQRTGEPVPVPWPGPGTYLVSASCAGQEARRLVVIGSWDDLRLAAPDEREALVVGGVRICGAALD